MRSLTDIEAKAMRLRWNFADGHARQQWTDGGRASVLATLERVLSGPPLDYESTARGFLNAMAEVLDSETADSMLAYSASVTIDIVAKWAARDGRRVWLTHPTFDNLAALLRMAGIDLNPIAERHIEDGSFVEFVAPGDCIFLVNPSNPTGRMLGPDELVRLFEVAAQRRVVLILDMSFRLFEPSLCRDWIAVAVRMGCEAIVIDDTGKAISAHDSKMGILSCTPEFRRVFRSLHNDVLLNVSSLELVVLTSLLTSGTELAAARRLVGANRNYLDSYLGRYRRDAGRGAVGWLDLGVNGEAIVQMCARRGVGLLPGRQFYWSEASEMRSGMIRVALLRDEGYFRSGIDVMMDTLGRFEGSL